MKGVSFSAKFWEPLGNGYRSDEKLWLNYQKFTKNEVVHRSYTIILIRLFVIYI